MVENSTPFERQGFVKKTSRFLVPASALIVLSILAAVGMYAWYYRYNPCDVTAVEDASAFLVSQLNAYDAQFQFTTTVNRAELAIPVSVLQQIFMNTQAVAVPVCMQSTKNELIDYMRTIIRAFQAYKAQEAVTTIRDLLRQSDIYYDNFKSELEAVNQCAPFCAPWD
jgi:hypothetical protein